MVQDVRMVKVKMMSLLLRCPSMLCSYKAMLESAALYHAVFSNLQHYSDTVSMKKEEEEKRDQSLQIQQRSLTQEREGEQRNSFGVGARKISGESEPRTTLMKLHIKGWGNE